LPNKVCLYDYQDESEEPRAGKIDGAAPVSRTKQVPNLSHRINDDKKKKMINQMRKKLSVVNRKTPNSVTEHSSIHDISPASPP
jgi:hypothetical protein